MCDYCLEAIWSADELTFDVVNMLDQPPSQFCFVSLSTIVMPQAFSDR
jgi:hypothetical protein